MIVRVLGWTKRIAGEPFARLVNRGPEWGRGRHCAGLAERLSLPPMPQTVTKRPVPEWNRPSPGRHAMTAARLPSRLCRNPPSGKAQHHTTLNQIHERETQKAGSACLNRSVACDANRSVACDANRRVACGAAPRWKIMPASTSRKVVGCRGGLLIAHGLAPPTLRARTVSSVEPSADPEVPVEKFALSAGGDWIRTSITRARSI